MKSAQIRSLPIRDHDRIRVNVRRAVSTRGSRTATGLGATTSVSLPARGNFDMHELNVIRSREIHNRIVANDSDGHVFSSRLLSDDPVATVRLAKY